MPTVPRVVSNRAPRPFLDVLREELAAAEPWADEDLLALWVEKQRTSSAVQDNGNTVCRPGDLWTMGNHRLLCGDSTNYDDMTRLMVSDKASIIVTDPPYGVSYNRAQFCGCSTCTKRREAIKRGDIIDVSMTIANDENKERDQQQFIRIAFEIAKDACLSNASVYMFSASMRGGVYSMLGLSDAGVKLQSQLVWAKSSMVMGSADYQWRHEIIWYGWYDNGGGHRWFGGRQQTTVVDCRKLASTDHPNEKPVELIETFLANSSLPGEVVYEPFCGSGTAVIACERSSRKCRAIELSPTFCDMALKRWADYTGADPVREDGASFKELNNA